MRALFVALPLLALGACSSFQSHEGRCTTVWPAAIADAEAKGFTKITIAGVTMTLDDAKMLVAQFCADVPAQ